MILLGLLGAHVVAWAFTWALIEEEHILEGEFTSERDDVLQIVVSFFWPIIIGVYTCYGLLTMMKHPGRLLGKTMTVVVRAISSTALAIVRLPKKIAGMKEQKKLPAARVVSR